MAKAKYVNSAIRLQTTGASVQSSTTLLWEADAELSARSSPAGTVRHASERLARRGV
jgi:hypothetical protein